MPLQRLPEYDIAKLKESVSLAEVVGSVVELKRMGGLLKAVCPFHDDKDPSFTIYPNESYYCFGCRASGDALTFVQKQYSMTFGEAVQWLGERAGTFAEVDVPVSYSGKPIPVIPEIVEYYHSMLKETHREYYRSRLFTDATINREMWGWDGTRYAIPVWAGRPQESNCISVRLRKKDGDGPKYVGIRGSNGVSLYNVHTMDGELGAFVFFGEFDAALASQDGFPACSPTNGCAAWDNNWDDVFGDKTAIVIVPDRGEERFGHKLASHLGIGRCRVLSGLFTAEMKDYNAFRLAGGTPTKLLQHLEEQFSTSVEFNL